MSSVKDYTPSNCEFMSDDIRLIAQDLLKAKRQFKATGLSAENSHQRYKYAKLADIYGAVESALLDNNIILVHASHKMEDGEYLFTRLIHTTSGQWIQDTRKNESEKPGNQAKGSANTYMKKYAVLSLCAISPGEDDDCEEEERYIAKKRSEPCINNAQLAELKGLIKGSENSKVLYSNILKFNKIGDLRELKGSSFESVKSYATLNK